jgi:hypothetical protein
MGNFLHKAAEATTPFMDKTPLLGKKADIAQDLLTPKTGPAPPGYDPSKNPGAQLFAPPAGGNPNANAPAGSPPGGNMFGPINPGGSPGGYTPNIWNKGSDMLANPNPMGGGTPGAPAMPPGPQMRPGMPPSPGMTPGGPPGMATGGMGMSPTGVPGQNPQLQQQMAIAGMLRNRGMQPRQL